MGALDRLCSFLGWHKTPQDTICHANKTPLASLEQEHFQRSALVIHERHGALCTAFSSRFGGVPMGTPGETWPTSTRSDSRTGFTTQENLFFLGQINVRDEPFVPEPLKDLALISFFVDPEFTEGDKCCVRAYKTLEELTPLIPPQGVSIQKACAMVFEKEQDTPCHGDPVLQERLSEADEDKLAGAHLWHGKIGGYASPIQSYPFEFHLNHPAQPAFCLQFFEIKCLQVFWVDNGALYIARGRAEGHTNAWFCDIQFY